MSIVAIGINRCCCHDTDQPRALRVLMLVDAQTDRAAAAAAEAVAGTASERFRWIDAAQIDAAKRREVLACLFAPAVSAQHPAP